MNSVLINFDKTLTITKRANKLLLNCSVDEVSLKLKKIEMKGKSGRNQLCLLEIGFTTSFCLLEIGFTTSY